MAKTTFSHLFPVRPFIISEAGLPALTQAFVTERLDYYKALPQRGHLGNFREAEVSPERGNLSVKWEHITPVL